MYNYDSFTFYSEINFLDFQERLKPGDIAIKDNRAKMHHWENFNGRSLSPCAHLPLVHTLPLCYVGSDHVKCIWEK